MLIFVCFYLILLFLVGTVSRRRVNQLDDYYLAGRSLSMRWAVPTIVAAWFGMASVQGVAAAVYSSGMGTVLPDPFGAALAFFICALFYAGRLYKANLVTINELIKRAYGSRLERLSSIATLPFYIGTVAAQLVAIGYLIHSFTQQSLSISIVLAGAAAAGYTMLGGMWAVVIIDIIQLGFLVLGLAALLFPMFSEPTHLVNTLDSMWNGLSELAPRSHEVHSYLTYFGQIAMTGLGGLMGQDLMQRVFACKNRKVARRSLWISAILYLMLGLAVVLLSYYARTVFVDVESNDVIFALARRVINPTALLLFILCMLSATMSSANGYLLAGSSIVCHGLLRLQEKGKDRLLLRARLCGFGLCLVAMALALITQNIYGLMIHSGAFLFVSLFVPVSGALFLDRPPRKTGWASLMTGIFSWVGYVLFHYEQWGGDLDALLYAAALVGAFMSAMAYLGTYVYIRWINAPRGVEVCSIADVRG